MDINREGLKKLAGTEGLGLPKWPRRVKKIIAEYRIRCNVVGEYLALKEMAIAFAKAEESAKPPESHAEAGELIGWIWDSDPGKPSQKRHYHDGKECPDFADSPYCSTPVPVYLRPAPAAIPEGLRELVRQWQDHPPGATIRYTVAAVLLEQALADSQDDPDYKREKAELDAGTEGPRLREVLSAALDWIKDSHDGCDEQCDAKNVVIPQLEWHIAALAACPVEGEKK